MRIWNILKRCVIIGLIVFIAFATIYITFGRPWIQRMGASDEEVKMSMAGDGLVVSPGFKYTQAITINAPKEVVWGYLVQVGYKRGGWYNWDFINRLADKDYFYENNKSAERIIPELQNIKKGDKIFIVPQIGFDVSEIVEKEYMLLTGSENDKYAVTWNYMLKEIDKDTTRLYIRWANGSSEDIFTKLINYIIVEPGGAGVQQSQMLYGIKKRAEKDYSVMKKK